MMKLLLALLMVVFSITAHGQDTAITYSHIKNFTGLNKDSLYDKIKLWSVRAFNSKALQADDRIGGLLAYNGYVEWAGKLPPKKEGKDSMIIFHKYDCKIVFQVKDEKYRMLVTDINYLYDDFSSRVTTPLTSAAVPAYGKSKNQQNGWLNAQKAIIQFFDIFCTSLDSSITQKDDF